MRKIVFAAAMIGLVFMLSGCNYFARNFGGTQTIDLPAGKKYVNATWHDSDLWYSVRDMKLGEEPETIEMLESSNGAVMQGKVLFVEHAKK